MRGSVTEYGCENCTRTVYAKKVPVGWGLTSFSIPAAEFFKEADLCESCVDAFVSAMRKRRRIEGGSYEEEALPIHNPPHPDNASASPFRRSRKKPVDGPSDPVKH